MMVGLKVPEAVLACRLRLFGVGVCILMVGRDSLQESVHRPANTTALNINKWSSVSGITELHFSVGGLTVLALPKPWLFMLDP